MDRIKEIESYLEEMEKGIKDEVPYQELIMNILAKPLDYIEYLLLENKRLREVLTQAISESQIFASHIAYNQDKYYHLDPNDTFEKAQDIYEYLEQALREVDKHGQDKGN